MGWKDKCRKSGFVHGSKDFEGKKTRFSCPGGKGEGANGEGRGGGEERKGMCLVGFPVWSQRTIAEYPFFLKKKRSQGGKCGKGMIVFSTIALQPTCLIR